MFIAALKNAFAGALHTAEAPSSARVQPSPPQLVVTLYAAKLYRPHAPSAYNLTRLATLADRVFLMGYDMTWPGAPPGSGAHEAGPNSPLDGLASVLTTALTELGAPAASLLLGLPLYGRLYDCDGAAPPRFGNCSCATNCKRDKQSSILMAAAGGPGCVRGWLPSAATPFFDCAYGSNVSTGGGEPPGYVRQQAWFEDARSIRAKLQLARERRLAGVAIWSAHGCPSSSGGGEEPSSCSGIWDELAAFAAEEVNGDARGGAENAATTPVAAAAAPSLRPVRDTVDADGAYDSSHAKPKGSPARTHDLFGLTLQRRPGCALAGCTQLVRVNATSGALTKIGESHPPIAPVGDLAVIDASRRVLYYLGDGLNGTGTVLVGLALDTGARTCTVSVEAIKKEVGIVGGEQSLEIDLPKQRLIISGPAINRTSGHYHHLVLSAALPTRGGGGGGGGTATTKHDGSAHDDDVCPGPFQPLLTFGYADYEPLAHGTGFDVAGQRLFVTVSSGAHTYAIAIVDGQSEQLHLLKVDVASGTVTSHARLHGDVGSSGEVLMSMALAPARKTDGG